MIGWNQGIKQFCTTKNGYIYGKNNEYNNVCPKNLEPKFLKGYKYGSKIRKQRRYISRLEFEKQKHSSQVIMYDKKERRGEKNEITTEDYNDSKKTILEYENQLKTESSKLLKMKSEFDKKFEI